MRIALAQLNPIIGDVAGNAALILKAVEHARHDKADVLVTSELALIGYPPRDLLLREGVVESCERAVQHIAEQARSMTVLIGHPRRSPPGSGRPFHNSVSICSDGKVLAICDKQLLPGYDVFDEDRYFDPGNGSLVVQICSQRVGVLICEDLWRAKDVRTLRTYDREPVVECMAKGCDLILSLNASPFVVGKWQRHVQQMSQIAMEYRIPIIAVNQVGANDDLIFDGRSVAVMKDGSLAALLPGFAPSVQTIDLNSEGLTMLGIASNEAAQWESQPRELFHALRLGVRDYVHKTGNTQAFIGLSGGIDSALVAVIAAAALGPQHVHGVMMPSMYSSPGSISDSVDVAKRLGLVSSREISIRQLHEAMRSTLATALDGNAMGTTDENVQARLRGVMLMALSNATPKSLLLSTSNKSEIATGYSTLYGDMCGALAVLGDVTKTRIYELARWINAHHAACGFAMAPIPEKSLTKPPSAELRPNQTDQDTLPDYAVLDEIVERYIEREECEATIIAETGFDPALVRKTLGMIDRAQYKRDQAPVVLKTTSRAFGRGRPMPIVMKGLESSQRSASSGHTNAKDHVATNLSIDDQSLLTKRAHGKAHR